MSKAAIYIPVPMDGALDDVTNLGFTEGTPIYVSEVCRENPDDFGVAFYAGPGGQGEFNPRASMIAKTFAEHSGHLAPELSGDIVVVCDEELARHIIKSDHAFREDSKVVKAFRAWMEDYATANEIEIGHVFHAATRYCAHVVSEADQAAEDEMQRRVADMLGIRPDQVGVIRL